MCKISASGSTTTAVPSYTDPPQFYSKADDYFNKGEYEVYCYAGTNIGVSRMAYDWVVGTHTLTVAPAATSAYDATSYLELHRIFYVSELRDAINQAISFFRNKYFIDLKDETTISLTRTARNDNDDSYIYTYEYSLPTNCLYLWRVTTEDSVAGVKITGTLSDAFTLGETVTGSSSGATGLVSYSGSGYIRVREESGTFTTSDTVTGTTSAETVTTITAIDRTESAGDGTFPPENEIDKRDWAVIKAYAPKLKLIEYYYDVVEDLRLRLDYQGIQNDISADTDTIFLPPDELVEVAATFLPFNKIESNNLVAVFQKCLKIRDLIQSRPSMRPYANARKCW